MKVCRCDLCKNYVYHRPTWNDPTHEEYCKIYGDFYNMECDNTECKLFELSEYGKIRLNFERKIKLERIVNGLDKI